jgi:glycosyltransferase involved in cell wall biosynthesis
MTVLLTHERFMPDYGGGGEYVVLQTAKHLQKAGVKVRVLTTGDPSITEYDGVPTRRLAGSRYRMNLAALEIAKAASAADIDLIQTFNYHACLPSLVAGKLTGKPVFCSMLGLFQDAWLGMRGRWVGRMYVAMERIMVRRNFARIFFFSDYSRELGIRLGARPELSLVTFPGIDPERFKHEPKDGTVLYSGKYEQRKGVYDFLDVARSLPSIRFRMTGWGPEEAALRAAAPKNVEFLDLKPGPALDQAYERASVFLSPSRAETFGIGVAEAMAAGCTIVSTIPLGYEGTVVQPGDTVTMTTAIRQLLSDPDRAAVMGAQNRAKAASFTWERNVKVLLDAYNDVLKTKGVAGNGR